MMDTAFGQFDHLLDRIAILGVDHIGRPEFLCKIELGALGVDGDDAPGAGNRCAVDAGEADAAAADHGDHVASSNVRRMNDSADARHNGAPDQSCTV